MGFWPCVMGLMWCGFWYFLVGVLFGCGVCYVGFVVLVWVFGFRRLDFLLVLCFELVVLFVLVAVWCVLPC